MSWSNCKDQELTLRTSEADQLKATLFEMLRLVNDWLKFAEAKNGGVVGLASAAIAVLLNYIGEADTGKTGSNSPLVNLLLLMGGSCLIFSVLVGVASFLPQTNLLRVKYRHGGKTTRSDNLYYFGHLARYSPGALADAVAEHYVSDSDSSIEEVHLALAAQVVVNARITVVKLHLFTTAGVLLGAGIIICATGLIVEYT